MDVVLAEVVTRLLHSIRDHDGRSGYYVNPLLDMLADSHPESHQVVHNERRKLWQDTQAKLEALGAGSAVERRRILEERQRAITAELDALSRGGA